MFIWLFTHSLGSADYGERLKVEQWNSHGVPALSANQFASRLRANQPPKRDLSKLDLWSSKEFSKFHAETTNWGANDEW